MKLRLLPRLLAALLFASLCTGCLTPPAAEAPTEAPTSVPTEAPTPEPTEAPTPEPTPEPTGVPTAAPDPRYVSGERTPNGYTSNWLNLGYTLSSDMVMVTDDEINAMMDLGVDAWDIDEATGAQIRDQTNAAIIYEMAAFSLKSGCSVFILAEGPMLSGVADDQLIMELQLKLSYKSGVVTDEPSPMELLGVKYQTLKLSIELDGYLLRQWCLVRQQGDRMAYIILSGPNDAAITELLSGFSTLA